jgi:hypothetical protein
VHPPYALLLTPSSQVSPGPMTLSPQRAVVHALVHASPLVTLPSSHCSVPLRMPSPQRAVWHTLVHASVSTLLPSSHCSNGVFVVPSPQNAAWVQLLLQVP